MSEPCTVCGVGTPERPNAEHPICHACRCAIDRRREKNADEARGEAGERAARAMLHNAVVNLRQWRAARRGLSALTRYAPLPEHRGA